VLQKKQTYLKHQGMDSWVSGTNTLAPDPLSPVSGEVGTPKVNLVFKHIPQMLNWIEIWGIWRSSKHFNLVFLKIFPKQFLLCD